MTHFEPLCIITPHAVHMKGHMDAQFRLLHNDKLTICINFIHLATQQLTKSIKQYDTVQFTVDVEVTYVEPLEQTTTSDASTRLTRPPQLSTRKKELTMTFRRSVTYACGWSAAKETSFTKNTR